MRLGDLWRRLRFFARRDRALSDLDEEMQLHIELRARANRLAGLSPADADVAARRRFGNRLATREITREMWGVGWFDRLVQDLRDAARQLWRSRRLTTAAVLTLALGIGANTSMFTMLDATLFRPAPVRDPDQLVWIVAKDRDGRVRPVSYPDYLAYRDRARAFAGVVAFASEPFAIGGQPAERVRGQFASGNYFDVLGVQAARGRMFRTEEDVPSNASPGVVLSESLWRRRYASNPDVVGSPIILNGRLLSVIGIAPRQFGGLELTEEPIELWVPLHVLPWLKPLESGRLTEPADRWLQVVARLGTAVSLDRARADASLIAAQLASARPLESPAGAALFPLAGGLAPSNRSEAVAVFSLLGLVPGLVLLVACANVANLLLARAIDRRKELALRRALGASRSRLVRQLLTEAFLLAMLAGGVGVVASYILTGAIVHAGGVPAAISSTFWIDLRVLVATSVLAMLTTVVFGLAPALFGSNLALAPTLKDEAASTGPARRRPRLRNSLIVAQVTASVVLIVVAALLLQSIAKALKVEPGFDIKRGATLSFDLGLQGYGPDARAAFIARLLAAVEAMPEVESAALADVLPLSGSMFGTQITAADAKTGDGVSASFANVTAGYFRTLGIPLLRGRDFTRHESTGSAPLAIVNETLARRLWANRDPIGQRVRVGGPGEAVREVIGVARDGRYDNLGESPRGFVYMPQGPSPITGLSLVTRTRSDPGAAIAPLRRILQGLDPNLPVYRAWTLEQSMRETLDKQRAASALVGVFGLLTLALAALGIYSVTSHAVTLRTREIGIRMALGAQPALVVRMFVREGLRLSLVGILVGQGVCVLIALALASSLYGLAPVDALAFIAGAAVLSVVAVLASYLPARRAASITPLVALRSS